MSQSNLSIQIDSFTVPYSVSGDGPALLCAELPLNSFARFRPLQKALSTRYRVYVIDLRPVVGYSAKQPPADDLLDFLTGFSVKVMDSLQIHQCTLVGSFMFGAVSMNMARQSPERIRNLVLLGSLGIAGLPTTPLMRFITSFYRLPGMPFLMRIAPFRALVESSDHYLLGPVRMREMFEKPELVPVSLEDLYEHYQSPRNDYAGKALLWAIRNMKYLVSEEVLCPALIVHGENDKWISKEDAEELRSRLPDAELVVISGTRHAPELEDVDATRRAIEAFLDKTS